MHGIGGIPGANDDFTGLDFDAMAAADQIVSVVFVAEDLGKPVAQAGFLLLEPLMLGDELVLAPFQRMIQFGNDIHLIRDEFARAQDVLGRGGQVYQHQLDAEIVRAALDLRKTVGGRRIDAGDELEVEQRKRHSG